MSCERHLEKVKEWPSLYLVILSSPETPFWTVARRFQAAYVKCILTGIWRIEFSSSALAFLQLF